MQEHQPGWSERVLTYQSTGEGRRALLDELATYTYRYPRRKLPTLDEDAPGEFYLFCHDKLEQLIVRFRDHGKPFEHYLNSVLSWQLRSFLAKRRDAEHAWQTALRSRLWEEPEAAAQTAVPPPAASSPWRNPASHRERRANAAGVSPRAARRRQPRRANNVRPFPGAAAAQPRGGGRGRAPAQATGAATAQTARRRLLFGVLKTGHRLEEQQVAAAAQALGCDLPRLRFLIEQLRRGRESAHRRLQLLRERRTRAFAQLQLWSAAAHQAVDDARRAHAVRRAARHRRAVETAQSEISRVRVAPSNREIAALLGIPKGTVDTGIYWLRRQSAATYAATDGTGAGEQQSA